MYFTRLFIKLCTIVCIIILAGCQSTGQTLSDSAEKPNTADTFIYEDSTVYFANDTASVSMRASFLNTKNSVNQPLAEGYKFQFRSINPNNISISQVSIIAGGKKITLAEEAFFVPDNQGITLLISLADTQFVDEQEDAVLAFKYNKLSHLFSLQNHTLRELFISPTR